MKKLFLALWILLLLFPMSIAAAQEGDDTQDLGMFEVQNCTDGLALTVERALSPEDTLVVAWLYFDPSTGLAANPLLLTNQSGTQTEVVLAHPTVPAGKEASLVAVVLSSDVLTTGALLLGALLNSGEAPDPDTLALLAGSLPVAVQTLPIADCSIGTATPTQSNVDLDLQGLFQSLIDFLESMNLPASGEIG